MLENTYRLRSEFDLPATAATREKEINGLIVTASSSCIGKANKICDEVSTALLFGAVPVAQLVMRERIEQANRDSMPLSCALSFGC